MNEKEVAEIRRRFRADKSNIIAVRGCYVNEQREIVSEFKQSMALTSHEESEQILSLLRKSLSGTLGKNLVDIEFETQQVISGGEHKLLMELRKSALGDDAAVAEFYRRVIQELSLEGSYMIMLAHDSYDVPYRSRDGESQSDASSEVFSYIVCSICPIKLTKPALSYYIDECRFRNIASDWVVGSPELGFMFPAFDDRSANIYNALYYTRDISENHKEFVEAVFKSPVSMPAAEQKQTFQSVLGDTVAEDCSLEVVQAVHERLGGMIEDHKANKDLEPLRFSKRTVKTVLEGCGVSSQHVTAFEERYDEEFGENAELCPVNVVDTKQLEIKTPNVLIRVNPERSDLIKTKFLNGLPYILIRAEEGVEVNGVCIHIPKE